MFTMFVTTTSVLGLCGDGGPLSPGKVELSLLANIASVASLPVANNSMGVPVIRHDVSMVR